ncbi:MAG: ABC transporter substrate-binding protein [Treponema sp.]|nr:ABC transporter substrate-binding protein [Treponema sp.]
MKKLISITLIVLMALMVTTCQRNRESSPAEGGLTELRYGIISEPVTLDPLSPANTADGRSILFNVYEGLVKPDHTGRLLPAIAESYSIEDNGLTYVFTLRLGVRFHDGSEVSISDVVFSLNYGREAGFAGFNRIESIEAVSSSTIRITLIEEDTEFLPFLTLAIVPESNSERERNPIGTGPYSIESYAPQQTLVLERNPHYWQSGLPHLDRVTIVFVADSNALLTGLMGGNIEGANITGSQISQLDSRQFDIIPWYSNMVQLLALNNEARPLDDIRVRLAINHAIDISEIIDIAFFGMGEPSGSPLIPGLSFVYEESLRDPFPRDINLARSLLAEAGYPNGFTFEIAVASNFTMHVDTAQVIINQLADIGIEGRIRLVDWATWLSDIYRNRDYEGTIISLDANNISPRTFLARYATGVGSNFINFSSPDFDRVFSETFRETDENRRASLYREAQRIISENAASVFIQDILGFRAFSSGRFGGVLSYPLYVIDFASIYRN